MNVFGEKIFVRDLETGENAGFEEADGDIIFRTEAGHEYAVDSSDMPLEAFEMKN